MHPKNKNIRQMNLIRYGIYFGLPFLTILVVFILQHMFPFGGHTLLTYDLNEQYIDFFSFYRNTLLHHPSQLLYSFTNGLGGETLGLWAYYLLSPFNLILLLTPGKWLPVGILIITLLKYGFAGYAICYFLEHVFPENKIKRFLPAISVCYALMGWAIANQFNIMWLDALILMPFVLYGIEKLIDSQKILYFTIFIALTLFINFYMGYMICVFACLYFVWSSVRKWDGWKSFGKNFLRFSFGGILGAGSVGFLLFPAYYDILNSKGQYMMQQLPVKFEYHPWEMISKFMIGALNDAQIQNGLPNLFVGSLIIIGFILYFTVKEISIRERITAALITVFLLFSICWSPLDLFWHLFQYPVFYPYRFSFVIGIWMIILAVRGILKIEHLNLLQFLSTLIIFVVEIAVVALNLKKFDFLNLTKVIWSLIFFWLIFILFILSISKVNKGKSSIKMISILLMTGVVVVEMGTNANWMLKSFSWANENDYATMTKSMEQNVKWIQKHAPKNEFYRIGKTYDRSENDSLQAGYNGISNFSSTQRAAVTHLMDALGQPTFTGKVNYTKGTPLTDALFDVRYYLAPDDQFNNLNGSAVTPATTYRPDISYYTPIHQNHGIATYDNPLAMGLGFAASQNVYKISDFSNINTAANQNEVLNQITGKQKNYFDEVGYSLEASNCHLEGGANGMLVTDNKNEPANYSIILRNVDAAPYYIQMDSNILWNADISVNGKNLPGVGNISHPALINVAANVGGSTVKVQISPKDGKDIPLSSIKVYRFNLGQLQKDVYSVKQNQLNLTYLGKLKLKGEINIPENDETLMTTIPYNKGWHVKVDGKKVKPKEALETFIGIPMDKGKHSVELSFWPPMLNLGILVTLISWGILFILRKKI